MFGPTGRRGTRERQRQARADDGTEHPLWDMRADENKSSGATRDHCEVRGLQPTTSTRRVGCNLGIETTGVSFAYST